MRLTTFLLALLPSALAQVGLQSVRGTSNPCFNREGSPQRCVPEFVNAAFNRRVSSSNTCGETRPNTFCQQTSHQGVNKVCDVCDARVGGRLHPSAFLTDFNNPQNETWWQSETMAEDIQHPTRVNLTLRLGKTFDITYVRLKFKSPRPESFSIYKKTSEESEWIVWAYYSATCRATYDKPEGAPILPGAETVAQCTKDYSDISPLTGGNVAFSTLEGRPSARHFEDSPDLQEWVTASSIRIVLDRLNTFGDEVFRDEKVLRSYYYAISDFAVGGRCKCNGHASECVKSTGGGVEERMVCRCEHNTMGVDCDSCLPFYNARPWAPATSADAFECVGCECNGLATRCTFDQELFDAHGDGGRCLDCTGNTKGAHCESCLDDHWRREGDSACYACGCDETGSLNGQCDGEGQCPCKPGVGGQRCDRCVPGFFEFSPSGCKDCGCVEAGSSDNKPSCRPDNGDCTCKLNVEGKQCDRCRPGHFSLSSDNEFGCGPCFCHGHSSICESAPGYFEANITAEFDKSKEKWMGMTGQRAVDVQHSGEDSSIAVGDYGGVPSYFVAPDAFLGDQRGAYDRHLVFDLRVIGQGARASAQDVLIRGANGKTLSLPIFGQQNPVPASFSQTYRFRLHEGADAQWSPRLSAVDFLAVLSNVTALHIRGTYSPDDVGFLFAVSLGTVTQEPTSADAPESARVETCTCPNGFVGQFCESCAPGYRREPTHEAEEKRDDEECWERSGPFARCIKCECHGHAELCEAESGACICEDNTAGDTCERCARGFFGNALNRTSSDCAECPCPERGPCILHTDGDVICLECPKGYSGRRCDVCADGHFGEPSAGVDCEECACSGNIDPNSIGNCDRITGECKKCVYETAGHHCEKCRRGFWGNALLDDKGDCRGCDCFPPGTDKPSIDYDVLECEQDDGQCKCLPHVSGQRCDSCEAGYFNLTSGGGCEACGCDPLGSRNSTCDIQSGQCLCKEGVTGRRCDACAAQRFGFGDMGCSDCDCERLGSATLQCDVGDGQCECRRNIEGRRCDQCVENMFNLQAGCQPCPPCYGLVQSMVNEHRAKLAELREMLDEIVENPVAMNDADFDARLAEVMESVKVMADRVKAALAGDDSALVSQINRLREDLDEAEAVLGSVDEILAAANATAASSARLLRDWDAAKGEAQDALRRAKEFLNTEGRAAWERARDASAKYGEQSQQLSMISQEARQLAEKHSNSSAALSAFATEALNTSRQALAEAREAIFGGEATSREITNLRATYEKASGDLNRTAALASEQQTAAAEAQEKALVSLNTVDGLELPKVDTEALREDAAQMELDAEDAAKMAREQAAENKPIVDAAERLRVEAAHELDRATKEGQKADEYLAEVHAAREKAREAVELAEATLREANETLRTLLEFDALVQASRAKAEEELKGVDDTKALIGEAQNRTKEAEAALGDAKSNAASAEEIAGEAETLAKDASVAAQGIRDKAEATRTSAENMAAEASALQTKTAAELEILHNYKGNAAQDAGKASEALNEATLGNSVATKTNATVGAALGTIKRVLDALGSVEDVKETELDALEAELAEAEAVLAKADLAQEVASLKAKQEEQQRKMAAYKAQIAELEKEVENVEQIRDSLPDQCFNQIQLEPELRK